MARACDDERAITRPEKRARPAGEMPKGGEVHIRGRNRAGGLNGEDAVEICITDRGLGMSSEAIARAFEPFFTTKDVGRGTGLGLSQVYGFVRSAGGDVQITSRPGEGTAITILLPRSREAGRAVPDTAVPPEEGDLQGLRVLLVEDDPDLNQLVSGMLEELGASVARASSAEEGQRLFADVPIDVVLSDMVMPGEMTGLDLARALRETREDMPIVLMTGFSQRAGQALEEGFPVLRKPFRMEVLKTTLGSAKAGAIPKS